ncbi:hypothetical protein WOLCODRAFT_97565 [Wolfiporia cocos MD-104 SS10]|uniref:Chromatin modification-related protein n=1 Tax=Wolfiporia cocos (strain MD-104) TaxID=742152 RepID=A0A2H3JIW9_WOLCO|nr:hypothetical protein WOLCODRAFT_97565 [Wolfiporia cocos MD-104 SS10]
MSSRRTRKRRTTEASLQEERPQEFPLNGVAEDAPGKEDAPSTQPLEDVTRLPSEEVPEKSEKGKEIWEAFKEENYEILEQLPLSLHRSSALMLELDQQVLKNEVELRNSLHQYIALRRAIAQGSPGHSSGLPPVDNVDATPPTQDTEMGDSITSPQDENAHPLPSHKLEPGRSASTVSSIASGTKSTLSAAQPSPQSSRQLLTHVAQLSEEIVRAANEKVNVARFAYDLADRYIRDLDRAIKEQETSITLGLRPGTYMSSIILPEVVPPPTIRAPRRPVSPIPSTVDIIPTNQPQDSQEADSTDADGPTIGIFMSESAAAGQKIAQVRPRRRKAKWSRKKIHTVPPTQSLENAEPPPVASTGLTVTIPPLASMVLVPDVPIDPNEPVYCYCRQVSYGDMIACDREECEIEWFHLGCVGLTSLPKKNVEWYCRECSEIVKSRKRKR